MIKNLLANAGDSGLIPGSGRSPGGGNGNPLQYSSLEKKSHGQRSLMDYSLWGHKESDTTEHTHTHTFVIGPFVDLSSATITIKAAITGAVGLLLGLD